MSSQCNKRKSSQESGGKQEYFKHGTTAKTRIGHILRQESLLRDIMGILGECWAKQQERKRLQILSDVTSKTYKDLKYGK